MSDLPKSIGSGTFRIFGVDLECHVLSDGRRVIEEKSLKALLASMASDAWVDCGEDLVNFASWLNGLTPPAPRGGEDE